MSDFNQGVCAGILFAALLICISLLTWLNEELLVAEHYVITIEWCKKELPLGDPCQVTLIKGS